VFSLLLVSFRHLISLFILQDGVVSHPDWSKLPKVWTKLETLDIRQCPALTTNMVVSSFVPQLTQLKEICLPDGKEEEEERQNAIAQLATQASPVILKFEMKKIQYCDVIKPNCRLCGDKLCFNLGVYVGDCRNRYFGRFPPSPPVIERLASWTLRRMPQM